MAELLPTALHGHSMFKFAPLTQETSVCLRCQLRLSLRKGSRRDVSHRLSTTPQQLRGFAPSRKLRQEQAIVGDDGILDEGLIPPVRKHDPFSPKWEGRSVPRTVSGHAGVKHLHKGHKDTLTFNALGEPAEVLVLDDGRLAREGRSDSVEVRSKRAAEDRKINVLSSSDMVDEIDAERGLANTDQVFENIEGIRNSWIARSKSDPAVFSPAEHAEISSQLGRGFTIRQLAVYFERADVDKPKDPLDLRYEFSSDVYSRSAWISGTPSPQQSRAPKLVRPGKDVKMRKNLTYENLDRHLSAKTMLVERILRQCWQFNVRQDESTEGELDIRLHATHLDLIMNHKRGILKQMSETYGAKIQASRHDRVMRVTSDYDTCLDVLKVIIFILENIRTSEIEPRLLNTNHKAALHFEPDTAVLKQVEQLTNTVIKAKFTANRLGNLRIYYLGPDDGDLQDVRRLIGHIMRPKPTDEGWLFWCGTVNQAETVPVPIDVGSGLALIHRTQQWSRWCSPNARKTGEVKAERGKSSSSSPLDNAKALRTLNKFLAPPRQLHESPLEASPYWQPNIVHSDSVTLGHVVFPGPLSAKRSAPNQAKMEAVKDDQSLGLPKTIRREFVSSIAGVFRLLQPLGSVTSNPAIAEYVQVHLTPSLSGLPVPMEVLPNLEIRVKLDNNTMTTSIEYVRLVHNKHLDFMLPQHTVDLRFIRGSSVHWQSKGPGDPRIQQFIQDSNFDIWGTDRLRTPTELALEIPAHAMRLQKLPPGEKLPGATLVDYTFNSLEHRSELLIPIGKGGEWSHLTYTNIEAGKLGGRRDELTLTNPIESGTTLSSNEEPNATAQTTIAKNPNPATLLSKLNTLINAIENQPENEYLAQAFTYGVEKEKTQEVGAAKRALGRTFRARRLALPRRTPTAVRKRRGG